MWQLPTWQVASSKSVSKGVFSWDRHSNLTYHHHEHIVRDFLPHCYILWLQVSHRSSPHSGEAIHTRTWTPCTGIMRATLESAHHRQTSWKGEKSLIFLCLDYLVSQDIFGLCVSYRLPPFKVGEFINKYTKKRVCLQRGGEHHSGGHLPRLSIPRSSLCG